MAVAEKPSSAESAENPAETCPRCHTTQSWGESSWCPVCSYYPVVDSNAQDGASWADDLPPEIQEEQVETDILKALPPWFWIMLGGIVVVLGLSLLLRFSTPDEGVLRGRVALVQLGVGAFAMLIAHGLAARYAFQVDSRANFNDILVSWFSLWQPTINRLPETAGRVWSMVWGIAAVVMAMTVIGGIDYAYPFRTERQGVEISMGDVVGAVAGAARNSAAQQGLDDAQTLDEALEGVAGATEEMMQDEKLMGAALGTEDGEEGAEGDPDGDGEEGADEEGTEDGEEGTDAAEGGSQETGGKKSGDGLLSKLPTLFDLPPAGRVECRLYGMKLNSRRQPEALLFATSVRGADIHAVELPVAAVPRAKLRSILTDASRAIRKTPPLETERSAVWIDDKVRVSLDYDGIDEESGELQNVKFGGLLVYQPGLLGGE